MQSNARIGFENNLSNSQGPSISAQRRLKPSRLPPEIPLEIPHVADIILLTHNHLIAIERQQRSRHDPGD
jgi:hypothetical protein